MNTIKSHTAHGNQFFYVETDHGFMCSFSRSFDDVWFCDDLDTDTPTEGPDEDTVEALIKEVAP